VEDSRDEPAQVVTRVCAIDIGKAGLVACVRVPHPSNPDRRVQEVREYASVTPALLALADWLRVERVELVAMEATSAYWKPVFYLLEAEGFKCWLLNAKHVKNVPGRPKTERDAADLADLLRMGRLPEGWIAPAEVRGLREAVRHRCKLVALRSGLKAQVHAVLAKQGVRVPMSDLFGVAGTKLLDELALDAPFHARVLSLRRLIDAYTFEIDVLAKSGGRHALVPVLHGGAVWPVEVDDRPGVEGVRTQATPCRHVQAVQRSAVHRQGPRRGRAVPGPAGEGPGPGSR
jgi:transposase